MEIHRFVPSHRTGCIWEGRNSAWNSCGICGLWWIDLFWTSVVYRRTMMYGFWCFLEACMLQEVYSECGWRLNIHLWKTTFSGNWFLESCGIFVWRWRSMGRYVECRFCLRMCMLDNKLQTFFNLVLFLTTLWTRCLWTFCKLHVSNWKLRFTKWDVYFKQRLHGRFSALFSLDDFCSGIWCSSTVHVNRMKEPNDSYRN